MKVELPKNILELRDLRQSNNWAEYLKWLGWSYQITKSENIIYMTKIGGWKLNKIQRPKQLSTEDLIEIEEICKKNKSPVIKIEPNFSQNIELMKKHGYRKSRLPFLTPTTVCIDLEKSESELWKALSHSAKYSINRAAREGYKVEFHKNPKDEILETVYKVATETSEIKHFIKTSLEDIKKKAELFSPESYVAVAKDKEGLIVAANFSLGHKTGVWYLHGGTTKAGRRTKAGYKLVWESFLYFKKQGYKVLDLEGKDDKRFSTFTKNWGGFSHFKGKFGGYVVEFPMPMVKPLSPFFKILEKIYGGLPV